MIDVSTRLALGWFYVANINDVAKHAGVSSTTAKRAIRTPELLRPETLKRVRAAIEALHYEPDMLASALRSGQSRSIGLMVGSIVEPFFAELIRTIGKVVRTKGYTLLVAENDYDTELELEGLKEFQGHRISGLIIRSGYGEPNLSYLKRMQKRGTAIVEIDYFYPDSPFSHVMLDNRACIFEGVKYLASLGHTRIAALGSYHATVQSDERVQAFPEAMKHFGLELPEAYEGALRPTQTEAYTFTHHLMTLPTPPTALLAITGSMAIGTFRALRELGLRVPQDVSLLSFDNYPWTELVEPPIDVIEQPAVEMGRMAVDVLLRQMDENPPKVTRERFSGKLIRRGSCTPPRKKQEGKRRIIRRSS